MEEEIQLLDDLIRNEVLSPEDREPAVQWLLAQPTRGEWARFLHLAGLGFGTACAVAGVLYLVAFNWSALGIYPRLIATYGALAVAGGVAARAGPRSFIGQLATLSCGVLVGAGLVLYSQFYQSGANVWTLFAAWSGLALPFVLASRTPPLWALLVVLLDLTVATGVGSLMKWEWGEPIPIVLAAVAAVHVAAAELWRGSWLRAALQIVGVTTWTVLGSIALVLWLVAESEPFLGGWIALTLVVVWGVGVQVARASGLAPTSLALLSWMALSCLLVVGIAIETFERQSTTSLFLVPALTTFVLTGAGYLWLRVDWHHGPAGGSE